MSSNEDIFDFHFKDLLSKAVDNVKKLEDSTFVTETIVPKIPKKSFFSQHISFEYDTIRAAKYGGSFAIIHKLETDPSIHVYDSCLNHMGVIDTTMYTVANYYVTAEELIAVLYDNGRLTIYDQRGKEIKTCYVFDNEFLVASSFYEGGLFCCTFSGNIYLVEDFAKMKLTLFANDNQYTEKISHCIAMPPDPTSGRSPYLWGLIQREESTTILLIQQDQYSPVEFPAKVNDLIISPDQSLALIVTNSFILITSQGEDSSNSVLSEVVLRINTDCIDFPINRTAFCGNSTIMLESTNLFAMIGSAATSLRWESPGGCCIFAECDGARVLSKDNVYYIRMIEEIPLAFVDINEKSEAVDFFLKVSNRREFAFSDPILEYQKKDKDKFEIAINNCLEATKFFRNIEIIKALLAAVTKYKHLINNFDVKKYSDILCSSRIACQLSQSPLNMPLTNAQLEGLTYNGLLIRLCNRFKHFHAYRIAEFLNEKYEMISNHWAHCLIRSNASPQEIMKRLHGNELASFDYVELATYAFDLNTSDDNMRRQKDSLALLLLKKNPVASRSVPLLIHRYQWDDAVSKAVESNDTSLLMFVLQAALKAGQGQIVENCITNHPIALNAWLKLNPEATNKAQLYESSGQLRDSLNNRFISGENTTILKEKAKLAKDNIDVDIYDRYYDFRSLCDEMHITFDINLSPYTVFDQALKTQDKRLIKSAVTKLRLAPDEVLNHKVQVYLETNDSLLFDEAIHEASEADLVEVALNLAQRGHFNEAKQIEPLLRTEDVLERYQKGIAKYQK